MRCPHCMTDIRVLFRAPDACPHCGRSLLADDGGRLREIDRDFEGLRQRLDAQTFRRVKTGTIVCAVLSLLNACLPPVLSAVLPVVILVQQIVWARPLVSAPYARYFSGSRRMITRWLSRFFVFSMASLHGGGAIPAGNLVHVVASPAIFVVTCGTAWAYHRFHLRREHDRQPVLLVEKVLLLLGGLLALLAVVGLVVLAYALGSLFKSFGGDAGGG